MTAAALTGNVVESFGRRVVVALPDRQTRQCKMRGRKLEVVVGDVVAIEGRPGSDDWVVVDRLPRRNLFSRSNTRGESEALAANLDQLAVVVAPVPACDPYIADRYLAGARYSGIDCFVIANKSDLPRPADDQAALDVYRQVGIPVVAISAKAGVAMDELRTRLSGRRTLLCGQSGVGKSTLFNRLSGGAYRTTRTLSDATGEGRHTTVSSAIVTLPCGELVDSPGVRDYAPPPVSLRDVQLGFPEIAGLASGCRFQDCLHVREPDCAVQQAVTAARIDSRRYDSYRRLLNLTRQLEERRGPRG